MPRTALTAVQQQTAMERTNSICLFILAAVLSSGCAGPGNGWATHHREVLPSRPLVSEQSRGVAVRPAATLAAPPAEAEVVQASHAGEIAKVADAAAIFVETTPPTVEPADVSFFRLDDLSKPTLERCTSPKCRAKARGTVEPDALALTVSEESEDNLSGGMPPETTAIVTRNPSTTSPVMRGQPISAGQAGEIFVASDVSPNVYPIDFRNALAIAAGENPQVAFAAARVREAYAVDVGARSMWLPNFSMGASFYSHNGQLQNAVGNVFDIDRGATYAGLGSRATGTSTPKVPGLSAQFALADAIYQPLIARQKYVARRHDAAATTNDVLLSTALAYLELLNAHQLKSISEDTRDKAADLANLTSSFAKAGQGPQSDADRAATELTARNYRVVRTIEAIDVASARLIRQLSMDAGFDLSPIETELIPVHLVAEAEDLVSLVQTGLQHRQELASSRHLVGAACAQLRKERASVLLPNFGLSASYGGFGGGQNSDYGRNFDPRIDFESWAFWQLRNLGFGERAAQNAAGARLDQARAMQLQLMDQVAAEISEAHARVRSRSRCIAITREGIDSAEQAYDRDVKRIRHGEGLPIEALTSLRALDAARRDYATAILEYNQAQFELLRALGWPGGQNAVVYPAGAMGAPAVAPSINPGAEPAIIPAKPSTTPIEPSITPEARFSTSIEPVEPVARVAAK